MAAISRANGTADSIKGPLTIIDDLPRHRRQRRKLIRRRLRMLPRQTTHERTLAHRREPYKPYTRDTRPCDIKACAATTTAATRGEELALQLGELGFELAEMEGRGFVFLRPGHLWWGSPHRGRG